MSEPPVAQNCTSAGRVAVGFTLVELSVVLLVIGLLAGAVLVGQELLRAAEIRATIAQHERLSMAMRTFQSKYSGLPGDLRIDAADEYGLFTFSGSAAGGVGMGDGNGLIEMVSNASGTQGVGEPLAFWRHLSEAGLIGETLGVLGSSAINPASGEVAGVVIAIEQSLPRAKIEGGNFFVVYSARGAAFFELAGIRRITAGGYDGRTPMLRPEHARDLDAKIDDGYPNRGNVVARRGFLPPAGPNSPITDPMAVPRCVVGTAAVDGYLVASDAPGCALRLAIQ